MEPEETLAAVSVEVDGPHYSVWTHAAKVEFFVENLASYGVRRAAAAPPLYRLLWKIGLKLPPPAFLRYGAPIAIDYVAFTVFVFLFSVGMKVTNFIPPFTVFFCFAIPIGMLFSYFSTRADGRANAMRHYFNLPRWRDYPPPWMLHSRREPM
jgi:hypothetical protein